MWRLVAEPALRGTACEGNAATGARSGRGAGEPGGWSGCIQPRGARTADCGTGAVVAACVYAVCDPRLASAAQPAPDACSWSDGARGRLRSGASAVAVPRRIVLPRRILVSSVTSAVGLGVSAVAVVPPARRDGQDAAMRSRGSGRDACRPRQLARVAVPRPAMPCDGRIRTNKSGRVRPGPSVMVCRGTWRCDQPPATRRTPVGRSRSSSWTASRRWSDGCASGSVPPAVRARSWTSGSVRRVNARGWGARPSAAC